MPKENKHKRGRREEKKLKRKREDVEDDIQESKRQKSEEPAFFIDVTGTDPVETHFEEGEEDHSERPFYGILQDDEQEYFRRADELLELNDFPSPDDRSLFLANVYREADGKELKIACSQSCSRLMERLILLSTIEQKKNLFGKFAGNFTHLVQHRFASHCCETLFIQSAPIVTEELTADYKEKIDNVEEEKASMETLFLQTLDELEGQMTFLLTDRFASHTLRVLLVILSGRPLEKSSTKSLLQSKRKEKISVAGMDSSPTEFTLGKRSVPSSFQFAIEKIISDTIATMDKSFIRVLATHPTGNPTLQLLLELELTNPNSKKGPNAAQKTIISSLLPDDITSENSESVTLINGLLYDTIGSRLLETICTFAPGKLFKQIYRTVFKDRIAAISRNEISSYVAIQVLTRISKEDLEEAVVAITPQIPGLVERNRTVIIKTLLERCQIRDVDTTSLIESIASAYGNDPGSLVLKMACIDDVDALIASTISLPGLEEADEGSKEKKTIPQIRSTPSQLHGSLLAQSMLSIPGLPSTLIQNSLLALQHSALFALSLYTTTSHIIQSALLPTSINTIPFRRKLINLLLFPPSPPTDQNANIDLCLLLALSPTGSHVLDALLTSTSSPALPGKASIQTNSAKPGINIASSIPSSASVPLFNLTERIASALASYEHQLRDSWTGRIVWRNWSLDLFKRRRGDWVNKVKSAAIASSAAKISASSTGAALDANNSEASHPSNGDERGAKNPKKKFGRGKNEDSSKTAIQLAREKFAAAKLKSKSAVGNPNMTKVQNLRH